MCCKTSQLFVWCLFLMPSHGLMQECNGLNNEMPTGMIPELGRRDPNTKAGEVEPWDAP